LIYKKVDTHKSSRMEVVSDIDESRKRNYLKGVCVVLPKKTIKKVQGVPLRIP